MILFLIELYLLGVAAALQFRHKLPDVLLSLMAVFWGLFLFFLNMVALILLGVRITAGLLAVIHAVEIISLLFYRWWRIRPVRNPFESSQLFFVLGGVLFVGFSMLFRHFAFLFASPDSMYMVVMAKSLLETGFAKWYFASPLLWGIFVPILQTMGLLFGDGFTWFIQPVLSLFFLLIFIYTVVVANQGARPKWLPLALALMSAALLLSSNMYWVAQFYVHTNLNSAIMLFLSVAGLYFAVKFDNPYWLSLTGTALIMFGMLRTENVLLAGLLILLTIASQKISHRHLLLTFLPYLICQILWNVLVIAIDPVVYSNLLSRTQLMLVTGGLVALILLLVLMRAQWIREHVINHLYQLIPIMMGLTAILVFVINPTRTFKNVWANLTTLFSSGQWLTTFWVVIGLLILVKPTRPIIFHRFFSGLLLGFFGIIIILGAFKGSHTIWYDSVNRMYTHILPVMIFYLMLKISAFFSGDEKKASVAPGAR